MGKIKVIRKEGGSRIISITGLVPSDWEIITIDVVKTNTKDKITLEINKIK